MGVLRGRQYWFMSGDIWGIGGICSLRLLLLLQGNTGGILMHCSFNSLNVRKLADSCLTFSDFARYSFCITTCLTQRGFSI